MKIKKIFNCVSMVALLLCCFILTGCQLAQETYTTAKYADQLCGILVTLGYHEMPVNEKALNKLISENNGSSFFNSEQSVSLYDNQIDGMVYDDGRVEFPGIEGYYMGIAHEYDEKSALYSSGMVGPNFQNVHLTLNCTDKTEEQIGEGTLFISSKMKEIVYVNPVYEREDKTYYVIINQNGYSSSGNSTGQKFSTTLESTWTETQDKSTKSTMNRFKVNIEVTDEVNKTIIKEMNNKDQLIKSTEYHMGDSSKFFVTNDTQYVIVEEYLNSPSKKLTLKRNIYTMNKVNTDNILDRHPYKYTKDNGIIAVRDIEFVYE